MHFKVIIHLNCLQLLLSVSDTFKILLTHIKMCMYEFLLLVPGVFWSNLRIKNQKLNIFKMYVIKDDRTKATLAACRSIYFSLSRR